MTTAEAITFSILVGSAVGMILVALAVLIVAATTPTPSAPNSGPEDSDGDSDGQGEGSRPLTKTGRYLTDEDIAALADEAEAGYDPNQIRGGSPGCATGGDTTP